MSFSSTNLHPIVEWLVLDSRLQQADDALSAEDAAAPFSNASSGSAGFDLRACIAAPLVLLPNACELIPSGLAIHLADPSYCGLILPRSGLGHKHGVILGNSTGVIDSDYQGELKISLWNRSAKPYTIAPLERIAQLVVVPVVRPTFRLVAAFAQQTERGSSGYGSSGRQ